HEFDPVVTIGHLDLIPVGVRILEPAIPIETKAKKIGIKLLFLGEISDHPAGVKQAIAHLVQSGHLIVTTPRFDEGNLVVLWVLGLEIEEVVRATTGDRAWILAVSSQIFVHLLEPAHAEANLLQKRSSGA